jgi:hypothetical protein
MRIFEKEMKVSIHMHVNDDGSIVHNVMMQILQIFLFVS